MGRLTKNPEVKCLQDENSTAMARYTLAVDRRYRKDGKAETDFISCVSFGKNAEFAEKYLKKGLKILVSGRIQTGSYVNQEGNKVYATNVIIEEMCIRDRLQSVSCSVIHNHSSPLHKRTFFFLSMRFPFC